MSLYAAILELKPDNDPKAFLSALNLADGLDLLDKVPVDAKERIAVLKYLNRLYHPDSELHQIEREKAKKTELKSLGVSGKTWDDIRDGKCKPFNQLAGWFYKDVIRDPEWEMYVTGMDWVLFQLDSIRNAPLDFAKADGESLPEDKRLKALELTQKMWQSAQENLTNLKAMKRELDGKYEKSDKNFADEINKSLLDNSGAPERFAAKNAQKKA